MQVKQNIRISLSLVCLTLLIIFIANGLGFIPDKKESLINERINLSEAFAIQISAVIQYSHLEMIPFISSSFVQRNQQILSTVVKKLDGTIIEKYGSETDITSDTRSTTNLMKVQIFKDDTEWGIVEVQFKPLYNNYWWGFTESTFFRLTIFITILSFILYFLLVRKVLLHLDPYKVIPVRVKTALNSVSDGMVFIDGDGYIVLTNEAFEKKFDFKADEIIGKKLSSIPWYFSVNTKKEDQEYPWQEILNNTKNKNHVTLHCQLDNNKPLTLIVNSTPLYDTAGNICGALTNFSDITELEIMNYELENMTQFLRHEMSNALMGAEGTVTLLEQKEQLSESGKQLIARTQRLHNVIRHLLDSVKEAKNIEESFSHEETKPVRLDTLIEDIVNNYSEMYTDNKFVFESNKEKLVVLGSEERFIQMIDKLSANAINYSVKGTPIIFSALKDEGHVLLKIINQGAPLPDDKQKIFDLFASFSDKNDNKKNHGIGLYVVKLIAEAYGGSVKANARRDVTGAEFVIELPLVE